MHRNHNAMWRHGLVNAGANAPAYRAGKTLLYTLPWLLLSALVSDPQIANDSLRCDRQITALQSQESGRFAVGSSDELPAAPNVIVREVSATTEFTVVCWSPTDSASPLAPCTEV